MNLPGSVYIKNDNFNLPDPINMTKIRVKYKLNIQPKEYMKNKHKNTIKIQLKQK